MIATKRIAGRFTASQIATNHHRAGAIDPMHSKHVKTEPQQALAGLIASAIC